MKVNKISIILPIHNGESTLQNTFDCIKKIEKYIFELIIVNDGSSDKSEKIINNFSFSKPKIIIRHKNAKGLASSYNEAINSSIGNIILIIHQDILFKKQSFLRLIKPLEETKTVATSHQVTLPYKTWNKFNFWQKLFFARKLNLLEQGIDGKFDAFRKYSLIKVGLFDSFHFHSAGEDGDIVYRLKQIGKIIQTKALIIHVHQNNQHFSIKEIFRKQAQYSQAQGVLLRLKHFSSISQIVKTFFREILVLLLFIPQINKLSLILILVYSICYSFPIFIYNRFTFKFFLIPIINLALLLTSLYYSLVGFITKKQTL